MACAPTGAEGSDGELPFEDCLTNIGFILSNLGTEVAGLASRHAREVAFLRAKSSWLATELRELREARHKRRSSKQQSAEDDVPGEGQVASGLRDLVLRKAADNSASQPSPVLEHECLPTSGLCCVSRPHNFDGTDEQLTEVVLQATLRNDLQCNLPDSLQAEFFGSEMRQPNICTQAFQDSKDNDCSTLDIREQLSAASSSVRNCSALDIGEQLSAASSSVRRSSLRRNSNTSEADSLVEHAEDGNDAERDDVNIDSLKAAIKQVALKAEVDGMIESADHIRFHNEENLVDLHGSHARSQGIGENISHQRSMGSMILVNKPTDVPQFAVCKELISLEGEQGSMQPLAIQSSPFEPSGMSCVVDMQNSDSSSNEWFERFECIMSPVSPYRLIWELSGIVILFYDMVMIPMQAFDIPEVDFLIWMGWITLYYWTFDLMATFLVGYYSADGKLVMEFRQIALRYLKTWFSLDLMIIGVDWFTIISVLSTTGKFAMESDESGGASSNMSMVRAGKVLRILRLARLLRVMKLARSNFFLMVQERLASEMFFVMSNLFKNVSVLLMVSHFCACGWYTVGCIEVDGYGNWVAKYEMEKYSWIFSYLTSVHWALAQFANGEVLIEPQNILERTMCVLVLMASLVIFSSFVAIVGNTVQQLIQRGAHLRSQQWMMRLYLRQNGISLDLKLRVNRYVGVITDSTNNRISQKDVKLIELLSRPLQIELQTEVFSKHLIMHPFFVCLSKRSFSIMRNMCCNAVRQVLLSRGDTLFSPGEEVHLMYFCTVGTLQYLPSNKVVGQEAMVNLQENDFFCEAVLWTDRWLSCGIMRAETECELVGVNGHDFREIIAQYHMTNMLLPKEYGAAFINGLNSSLKRSGISRLSDLQSDLLQDEDVQKVLDKYMVKRALSNQKKTLKRSKSGVMKEKSKTRHF